MCFFPTQLVSNVSVVLMYVIVISCLLLSMLGVFGAWKGKRWCLILVENNNNKKKSVCVSLLCFCAFHSCSFVYLQYATGMAVASQTIIVRTSLSYQDMYEVKCVACLSIVVTVMCHMFSV